MALSDWPAFKPCSCCTLLRVRLFHDTSRREDFRSLDESQVVDTIRIVSANVEADLAAMIAPHLRRPKEAKKVIANLFAAPGRVEVTPREIRVRLAPAANRSERAAIRRLLAQVNVLQLTLPRELRQRPLRFELQPL